MLARFEVAADTAASQNPTLNVPVFILLERFDARKDTPVYDWDQPESGGARAPAVRPSRLLAGDPAAAR